MNWLNNSFRLSLRILREHNRAASQLRKAQTQTALLTKARDDNKLQATKLNQRLNQLNNQLKQQAKSTAATAEQVGSKQRSVTRWQEEIQFDKRLRQLRSQLEASEKQLVAKQQAIDQAEQDRKLADQKLNQAKHSSDESQAAVEAIREELQKLRE